MEGEPLSQGYLAIFFTPRMLQLLGATRVLCLDTTYKTNNAKQHLIVVRIFNDRGSFYPIAFAQTLLSST